MSDKREEQKHEVVTWIRLPRGISAKDALKKLAGASEVACYGGDHCITTVSPDSDAAILVHRPVVTDVKQLMQDAGLAPRADCFGGDTCIV